MKTLDIAWKDILRSVRSASFLAFGFVVPLLVSGLFYFAFSGLASDKGGFTLPSTKVQVVNQDRAQMGFSAGQMLLDILTSKELAPLLQVAEVPDPAGARTAVDRQEAGVAIFIPPGFSAAMFNQEQRAAIELYHDPTLTLGPGIVKSLIQQLVDGFAGSTIAIQVAREQFAAQKMALDLATAQSIALKYGRWAAALGESRQEGGIALAEVRPPAGAQKATSLLTSIVSMIMAGMLVFYVFFTGTSLAQSLLQEEEAGTLSRLFTTPTPVSSVLGGRILATLATLVVQTGVLLLVSTLVFDINWGQPLPLSLVTLGLILLAGSFGILLISLLKNSRQAGVVTGGGLTLTGMLGMVSIFTANVPGAAKGAFDTVSLLVPQGWAVRGFQQLLDGGGVRDVLLTVAVMLALSAIFLAIGTIRFRKRFA